MIESADTEQGSVVFLGQRSFRMQTWSTPVPSRNELAIPAHASENPTERLYGSNLARAFEPELQFAPVPSSSRRLVGLCLTGFVIGILVTSVVDRALTQRGSERRSDGQQTRPLAAQSTFPASSPPLSAGPAQPLAAAAPATILVKPYSSAAIAKPALPARVQAAPRRRTQRPHPALEPAVRDGEAVTPAPVARWVDPFAG